MLISEHVRDGASLPENYRDRVNECGDAAVLAQPGGLTEKCRKQGNALRH